MSTSSQPHPQPGLLVSLCGLGTSALALWMVQIANEHGENIMGWLDIAGCSLSAMLPSLAVYGMTYCKGCQDYLRSIAAGIFIRMSSGLWLISPAKRNGCRPGMACFQA